MTDLTGSPAPDFELPGSDGATHRRDDYAGRTLVVFFYPKDSTPGCTKEACGFRDAGDELAELGAVVLGVSADGLASHEKFAAAHHLDFVLLSDPDREMIRAYGAWGEKKLYGKTYEGIIRSTVIVGPDGLIRRHWPKVSRAAAHPEQVLQALREDAAGNLT